MFDDLSPSNPGVAKKRTFQRPANSTAHRLYLPLLALLTLFGCDRQQEALVVGVPISAQATLIWLADGLGYFDDAGLAVEIRPHPSGKRALAAMLRGEVELAVTAETPFAIASFTHPELRLFATIGSSDNDMRIMARRDHGITRPGDLAGKVIATQRASAVHYFLSGFLLYRGLDTGQTTIHFLPAEELPPALARGEVDAIAMREPFLARARSLIGAERLIEFEAPGLYTKTYNIVGTQAYINRHPGIMERFLHAVERASRHARDKPQQSMTLLAGRFDIPREAIARLWPHIRLRVTLNQGILTSLREEARWAVHEHIAPPEARDAPDFLDFLDPRPLRRVAPHAVGLIGLDGG